MSKSDGQDKTDPSPATRWSRWLPAVLAGVALLFVALLVWLIPTGRTIIAGTDRRNQADLAIAAAGLEQWSGAIGGLARANFIRGRVHVLTPGERDFGDKWTHRTWLRHPTLDEFKITYAVTTLEGCNAIKAGITANEGTLPFVANYNGGNSGFLKVVDSFPLALIRNEDLRPETGAAIDNRAYLATVIDGAGAVPADAVVCFAAGIPLDRLLVSDKAARAFVNLLIIDSRGRVAAQVGPERLPVKTLAGLVPETSVLAQTLAVSVGQKPPAVAAPGKLSDSLKPVDVDIGGRNYIAYIRPLAPPPSFAACKPVPPATAPIVATGGGVTTVTQQPPALAAAPAGAASECLVVAIMPQAALWRQIVDLPLAVLVAVGIAVVAGLAALPSLRLILLGPGEGLGRIEAIGVVLGIPAVVSMATLAVLLSIDIGRHRANAETRATAIAERAASAAGGQLRKAVQLVASAADSASPAAFPQRSDAIDATPGPRAELAAYAADTDAPRRNFVADPAPRAWPNGFCRVWTASQLPVLDSIGLVDEDGRQAAGSRTAACRYFLGGRANVSARDYFQRLRNGHPSLIDGTTGGTPYVVAHVAALQDGVAKSVIAMKTGLSNDDRAQRREGRDALYAIGTATLTTVIAPVLPPEFNLMVVDTRDDALPVLLHTTPGRSGAERLGAMVRDPGRVREELRGLHLASGAANGRVAQFQAYYDGAERRFVAVPIPGSRWVAIANYSLADIDREAADTALHTLRSWAAFSILFTLGWVAWLARTGSRGWPRLWPQEAKRRRYEQLTWVFTGIAAVGALVIIVGAGIAALVLIVGLAVRLAAALILHAELGRVELRAPPSGPLQPATERRYTQMLVALIACLSVVPMLGFWREAHSHTVEQYRRSALVSLTATDGTLEANRRIFERLRWAYGLKPPSAADGKTEPLPGAYGVALNVTAAPVARDSSPWAVSFSDFFDEIAGRAPTPPADGCVAAGATTAVQLCQTGAAGQPRYGVERAEPAAFEIDLLLVAALIGGGAALALIIGWLLRRVLRGLAGFGVPLEAFEPPLLCVADLWRGPVPDTVHNRQVVTLNRKSLLVNAPYIILPMLRMGGVRVQSINVADPQPAIVPIVEGMVTIVTGLELVLADRERRLRALALLESQGRAIARLGVHTRSRLIILSESAPLERILDAFERDERRTAADADRENLRWSRLFEDFATYNFRQSQLTGSATLARRIEGASDDPVQRTAIAEACRELRWLPQRVVAGALGAEILLSDTVLATGIVPVADRIYRARFEKPIIAWAVQRRFPGKAAVRSHLRNQCIEYYQKIWSSSTNAEHLVMHNLASGRFVNIGTAMAFASLVRRGVVVLDPTPRLMNESFGMFVRQAEKLDTIRGWQRELPRSAWVMARLPIFAVIGLMVAGLAAVVVLSGEDMTSLLPILAAGIPALIAATQRLFSRA